MNGWEFQRLIATAYPDLPVIVITGRNGQSQEEAEALGVFAFIHKPFDGEELIKAIVGV